MKYLQIFILFFIISNQLFSQIKVVKVNSLNNSPNEVSIAINPKIPSQMVAGANLSAIYYSNDSGKNWIEKKIKSSMGVYGDPVIHSDNSGNFYYGHLANNRNKNLTQFDGLDRIVIQKSIDGGVTFSDGDYAGNDTTKTQDKHWFSHDKDNHINVTWTEFDKYESKNPKDHSRIQFSRSDENGINFTKAITISDTVGDCLDGDNTLEGATTAVGPDGTIYAVWAGFGNIYMDQSYDNGVTWGKDQIIANQVGGWDLPVKGLYRSNGMAFIHCNKKGKLFLLYADMRYNDIDVWLKTSIDGGKTWSIDYRINNDSIGNGADQFTPNFSIDPVTDAITIIYYDTRHSSQRVFCDVYLAYSLDEGVNFINKRLTNISFPLPEKLVFFGDYIDIDCVNNQARPIWTDYNNRDLEIKCALINLNDTQSMNAQIFSGMSSVKTTMKGNKIYLHHYSSFSKKYTLSIRYNKVGNPKKIGKLKVLTGEKDYIISTSKIEEGSYELILKSGNETISIPFYHIYF